MATRLEALLGERVIRGSGEAVGVRTLCGKDKVIGFYFSAQWCPPCKGFTPKLAEFYKNFKSSEKGCTLEIVFVSWDKDLACFTEYFSTMPWLALPYQDRDRKVGYPHPLPLPPSPDTRQCHSSSAKSHS